MQHEIESGQTDGRTHRNLLYYLTSQSGAAPSRVPEFVLMVVRIGGAQLGAGIRTFGSEDGWHRLLRAPARGDYVDPSQAVVS